MEIATRSAARSLLLPAVPAPTQRSNVGTRSPTTHAPAGSAAGRISSSSEPFLDAKQAR